MLKHLINGNKLEYYRNTSYFCRKIQKKINWITNFVNICGKQIEKHSVLYFPFSRRTIRVYFSSIRWFFFKLHKWFNINGSKNIKLRMEKSEIKLDRSNGKSVFRRFLHPGPILTICKYFQNFCIIKRKRKKVIRWGFMIFLSLP